jgi:glycine cleavage system H protein
MARIEAYQFPAELWYDPREHLWVRVEADGTTLTVGIDAMGQEALGGVVYVELAGAGREVRRGEALGSLEAEKMVRPVLAPVSGTLVAANDAVVATPRLLNGDPYGGGWLVRIRPTRWAAECQELLHGDDAVTAWARAELERHA